MHILLRTGPGTTLCETPVNPVNPAKTPGIPGITPEIPGKTPVTLCKTHSISVNISVAAGKTPNKLFGLRGL